MIAPANLEVVLDDETIGLSGIVVGTVHREESRGTEVVSFEYEPSYLDHPQAVQIDPGLPLHGGRIFDRSDRLFGVLEDCSPDRWGRLLMRRREAIEASAASRPTSRLTPWACLVGVDDLTRHGAVRLRVMDGDAFRYLDDRQRSVPPFSRLRELQELARRFEVDEEVEDGSDAAWLHQLIAPGSSLGGARPKASFSAQDGALWLAKFPSSEDGWDHGAWEALVMELARTARIRVAQSGLMKLAGRHRTFTAARFDRAGSSRRMFTSAMTMLQCSDGEDASYLELAEAVSLYAPPDAIETELRELYRRVVFSILVGNRDDHLRNHGFLREPGGWVLSPAFDLNPSPDKGHHALAIDEADPSPRVSLLRSTRDLYRLTDAEALQVESEVRAAVAGWAGVAQQLRISLAERRDLGGVIDPERE